MTRFPSAWTKWKWCVLPTLAMVFLSLLPQIHLWVVRGREWNGAYVSPQGDEPLYSAYINALIDGRTRKNDPFGARDSSLAAPLPESIFSIQFVPAYVISFLARTSGASASTAFIVLIAAAALFASLAVFWLLNSVAADPRTAAAGTLFVLCLGGFAGSYGVFGTLVDVAYPVLPFLRRYQPALAFPLFFVFIVMVWRALTTNRKHSSRLFSLLAGATLTVLIFSYLYLWTAALAWLVCIGTPWLYFRPKDRRNTLAVLITIGLVAGVALVPYLQLVSHRAVMLDQQQILTSTHRPDLFRVHEIMGAVILLILIIAGYRRRIEWTEPSVIFAASLACLPLVVFNQQVLTGSTMQVFHFEIFAVNYSTLIGLVITLNLLWKRIPPRLLIWTTTLCLSWGLVAVGLPSRLVSLPLAIANDRRIPVLLRLRELSREDGTLANLHAEGKASTLVFSPSVSLIRLLPTWTSQGTLLDITGVDCGTVTREERKHIFYMHLYYSKVTTEALRNALNGQVNNAGDELSSVRSVVFGHQRIFPGLTSQFEPIRQDEIEREVQSYETYANSFSGDEAHKRPIAYAVVPAEVDFDFTNLDRWYERNDGERVGANFLYRLKLRN